MDATAKVWNDWTQEHVELFKGETIRIPAKGFIEMPWPEAVQFRGQYSPIRRDGNGRDLAPKMIRLEKKEAVATDTAAKIFTCQMDRQEFNSQDELDEHIATSHSESMLDEDAKKKLKAKIKA